VKILLIGYYGKGNFGDDLLFTVAWRRLRRCQHAAEITVLCDGYLDDYLSELVGEPVRVVAPGERGHYDLIVHGGGGTFFDFGSYGLVDRVFNRLIGLVGARNFVAFDRFVRTLVGRRRPSAERRIGWGIGVGTYMAGSRKLRDNLPTLLDFDSLIVRDSLSLNNLRMLGITDKVSLGSDLAFLGDYWVPAALRNKSILQRGGRPRIGLILRDWPKTDGVDYLETMFQMLPELGKRYDLSLFVFDRRVDRKLLAQFVGRHPIVWSPPETDYAWFCEQLAVQDVIVSSRAHGGICGAMLGVPSLLIDIEPKLRTVHAMLPEATRMIGLDQLTGTQLVAAVEELLALPYGAVADDITRNRLLMTKVVNETVANDD